MNARHLGTLPEGDPLYSFLRDEVLGRALGAPVTEPDFEVAGLDARGAVFRYVERRTGTRLVAKFYSRKELMPGDPWSPAIQAETMRGEFENLERVRALGLDLYPHRAVRPLAFSERHGCVLVEEHAPGEDLEKYLDRAVRNDEVEDARRRVATVAAFLADLHDRSFIAEEPGDLRALGYLERVTRHLAEREVISPGEHRRLRVWGERWAESGLLRGGDRVFIHGDANPTHFWLSGERGVTAIDLERSAVGDRAADLGYLAGELKHLFWHRTGDPWAGEPYIRDLYSAYARNCPHVDFDALTVRGQFFMACSELRIGRNDWLDLSYRRTLVNDAEACLRI